MRISDWSSDVCSSDLLQLVGHDSLGENGTRQRRAKLAPPCIDQAGRNIIPAANLGNARARRKRLVQDLKPLILTPPQTPLGAAKQRYLAHIRPNRKSTRLNSSH